MTFDGFRSFPIAAFLLVAQFHPANAIEEIHVVSSIFDKEGEVVGFCHNPPDWVWVKELEAIQAIDEKLARYYTEVDGNRAYVEIRTVNGERHIFTEPDGFKANNLSSLGNCPDQPPTV